ncbi:MAG: hypothetical protein C4309_11855, partial [Chloroflexota bacterium]
MDLFNRRDRRGRKDFYHLFALFASFAVLSALFSGVSIASAQGPTQDDVNRVANQLYCPVCENITLANCPTQACIQWRARI